MSDLVTLRQRVRDLESTFRADIEAEPRHSIKDLVTKRIQDAKVDLRLAERAAKKAAESESGE